MSTRAIVLPLLAAALLAGAAAAARAQHDHAALRRMLAAQPDYTATSTSVMYAGDHAFGGKSKVAKSGGRYYEDNGSVVFLYEKGKPTVKVYHDRKAYAELPPNGETDFAFPAEALAAREDVTFKLSGREMVGEYDTLKIEATVPLGNGKEFQALMYAAPGLKNLVVKVEFSAGGHPITMSFLEGVSLDVPEELFAVPKGYAKVVEKAPPADPAAGLLEELRRPAGGRSRPPKPRRD